MRPLPFVALIVHIVSLSIWLGGVATSGLAAAIIFPTMKGLDPQLPEYAAYTGDHWMLAAGRVAARIFRATDIVQGVCALLAAASAGVLLGSRAVALRTPVPGANSVAGRPGAAGRINPASLVWMLGLGGSLAALGVASLWLRPRMDASLHAYWDAALAGENPAAESAREAFSADHPLASNLMAAAALLVLLTLIGVMPAAIPRAAAASRKASVATGSTADGQSR